MQNHIDLKSKPTLTQVKIAGANSKVVAELKDLIISAGFDIVMTSKNKPKLREVSGVWLCYILVHEEVSSKVDEALCTVEGV